MSKFFKALEQAERDRALREDAGRQETTASGGTPGARLDLSELPPATAPVAPVAPPPRVDRPVKTVPRRQKTEPTERFAEVTRSGLDDHLVSLVAPSGLEAEQYRALRLVVERLHRAADLAVVAISSPGSGDGKTTTAINLAGALTQSPDLRVLLVDADLRRPAIHDRLALKPADDRGLVGAILDPALTLDDVARPQGRANLTVVPAGRVPDVPYEILKAERLGALLAEARRRYDYVILDTPPLVTVPDCRVIEKWIDGFVVVVAANQTPRKLLEEALGVMDPTKIVGLVLNADDHRPLAGYYYGAYGANASTPSVNGDAGWWRRTLDRFGGARERRRPVR